jgi:hypothetical protein
MISAEMRARIGKLVPEPDPGVAIVRVEVADLADLLDENDALRAEIHDRAQVEADLRARAEAAEKQLDALNWKPTGWWCDDCDRIDPFCPECKGSGMDAASSAAAMAYAPCEQCGGDGREHHPSFYGDENDGVPLFGERAKLRARAEAAEAKIAAVQELADQWQDMLRTESLVMTTPQKNAWAFALRELRTALAQVGEESGGDAEPGGER